MNSEIIFVALENVLQNQKFDLTETIRLYGLAVLVNSAVEKTLNPVLHISARKPVSNEERNYHQSSWFVEVS